MEYEIRYYNEAVQDEILELPDTLAARYVVLTRRMVALGPNLGAPHPKAMKNGLFELRLKGAEGIARVFYCTQVGRRIVCCTVSSRRPTAHPCASWIRR